MLTTPPLPTTIGYEAPGVTVTALNVVGLAAAPGLPAVPAFPALPRPPPPPPEVPLEKAVMPPAPPPPARAVPPAPPHLQAGTGDGVVGLAGG